MRTATHNNNIARIEVQRSFCQECGHKIRRELLKIEDISNVALYPESTMVVFGFSRANELSKALNLLTELGYPEIGEVSANENKAPQLCGNCQSIECAA